MLSLFFHTCGPGFPTFGQMMRVTAKTLNETDANVPQRPTRSRDKPQPAQWLHTIQAA
jgi:hypothetical protein